MKKYISDKELLNFTKLLIFDKRNVNDTVGIPIGNYSSQFFANIYLNELDQYVKRILKIKYYTRYMDDFIFLLPTKKSCIKIKTKIQKFLTNELHLSLNNKSKYYPYKMGVNSLALQSLNSWLGHSSHCNSYKLQQKILNNCNFIVNSNYYNSIENSLIELIEADNKNFCLRPPKSRPINQDL